MARSMRTVMEADLTQFVSEMNKADRTIAQTADTVKQSTQSVNMLTSSFDTLTGGAICCSWFGNTRAGQSVRRLHGSNNQEYG